MYTWVSAYTHTLREKRKHTPKKTRTNTLQLMTEHMVKYEYTHTHLGVLKHAQVCVHGESSVVVATFLIQFGGLEELALVSVDVGLKEIAVALTSLLPLLCKIFRDTIRLAHPRKSSTAKCKSSMCLCKWWITRANRKHTFFALSRVDDKQNKNRRRVSGSRNKTLSSPLPFGKSPNFYSYSLV